MDANGKPTFKCLIEHDQPALLDSRGDHAFTCKNSKTVRIRVYNELRDVFVRAGKATGLQGRAEPPNGYLLGDTYSDQQLAIPWPGEPTTASIAHFQRVWVALQKMMAALPAQRVAEQQAVQVLLDSAPKGYGLSLDGELIAPDGSDLWFDVTMFHPTSAVRREGQLKWHMERAEKESNAAAAGLALPGADD
jgi:hypothetical protein